MIRFDRASSELRITLGPLDVSVEFRRGYRGREFDGDGSVTYWKTLYPPSIGVTLTLPERYTWPW